MPSVPANIKRALLALVGPPTHALGRGAEGEVAPVFYSPLEAAVLASSTKQAPAAQWLATLSKAPGVKQEELEVYDIPNMIRNEQGPVPREALLNRIANLRLALREQVAGGSARAGRSEGAEGVLRSREDVEREITDRYGDEIHESAEEAYEPYWMNFFDDYAKENMPVWAVTDRPHRTPEPNYPRMVPRDTDTPDLFGRNDPQPDEVRATDEFLASPPEPEAFYYVGEPILRRQGWHPNRDQEFEGPSDRDELEEALRDGLAENETMEFRPTGATYWDDEGGYQPNLNLDRAFTTREEAERALARALERQRERIEQQFRDDWFNSTEYHQAYDDARQQVIDEHIGEYDFDESTGVGVRWAQYALGRGQGTGYGELIITLPQNPFSKKAFTESHWGDTPNVVGHVRFSDRTDSQGKKTLFIEEMQSDWHQRGREGGYVKKIDPKALEAAQADVSKAEAELSVAHVALADQLRLIDPRIIKGNLAFGLHKDFDQRGMAAFDAHDFVEVAERLINDRGLPEHRLSAGMRDGLEGAYRAYEQAYGAAARAGTALHKLKQGGGIVPDVPFKDNRWASLMLKRMIRWAADNDYEQIGWSGNVKNGTFYSNSNKPAGWEFYDKVLVNAANDISKKQGTKVGRETFDLGQQYDPRGQIETTDGREVSVNSVVDQITHDDVVTLDRPFMTY